MNVKQFIVICACRTLPPDIICKIWQYILHSSANSIRAFYFRKVDTNSNILKFFVKLSTNPILLDTYTYKNINNFIKFYMNKIKYRNIRQEKLWISCFVCIIEDYSNFEKFNINNVYIILNNIFKHSTEFSNCRFTLIPY